MHAGELGEETEAPLSDWIEVGIEDLKGNTLYRESHLVTEAETELTTDVPRLPETARIDPLHVLVDRHPEDNDVKITRTEEETS